MASFHRMYSESIGNGHRTAGMSRAFSDNMLSSLYHFCSDELYDEGDYCKWVPFNWNDPQFHSKGLFTDVATFTSVGGFSIAPFTMKKRNRGSIGNDVLSSSEALTCLVEIE
ncbi:hypothetical protein CEXT_163821 [Caerostris extrusa]|uniref:Uncharacterized protein n=1 Tax=Caerostris extrusa TaxID=172846 RepID=A0AAV4URZ0_CAEEX|nr:hypothetical protein CEXT_163821 [Caerostris extrusa]